MDASYKIQRGIHVHLIQFFMCPEFWVHIKMCLLCDGFFSFAVALQITYSFYFELLLCYLMSAIGMNRQECKHK